MQTARISALLEPFLTHPLSEPQLNQISIYIDLLQRWNARINLTAIRTEEEIVTRHFGESLFLARHVFLPSLNDVARTPSSAKADTAETPAPPLPANQCHPERSQVIREADAMAQSKDPYPTLEPPANIKEPDAPGDLDANRDLSGSTGHRVSGTGHRRVLDIGSGAGFPALPLKIWNPQIHLTLIESSHKKSAFLREVSRALTFTTINVITGRAEEISARADRPQAELVTLRAVEHFEAILPQALKFLADHSTLALLVGTSQLAKLFLQPALTWQPPILIPNSSARVLLLGYMNNRTKK